MAEAPEWAGCRERLFPEDVEDRAANAAVHEADGEGILIDHCAARDVDDDRIPRQEIEPFGSQDAIRFWSQWGGKDHDIVLREFAVEVVQRDHTFESGRWAELDASPHAGHMSPERGEPLTSTTAESPDADDERVDRIHFSED